jgi:hypothetical protein
MERGHQGDLAGPEARRADMVAHLSEHSCRWHGRQRFPREPTVAPCGIPDLATHHENGVGLPQRGPLAC